MMRRGATLERCGHTQRSTVATRRHAGTGAPHRGLKTTAYRHFVAPRRRPGAANPVSNVHTQVLVVVLVLVIGNGAVEAEDENEDNFSARPKITSAFSESFRRGIVTCPKSEIPNSKSETNPKDRNPNRKTRQPRAVLSLGAFGF